MTDKTLVKLYGTYESGKSDSLGNWNPKSVFLHLLTWFHIFLTVSRSLPETKDPIVYISLKMDLIVSNLFLAQPNSKLPGIRVFILCATIMTIVETQQVILIAFRLM